MKNSKFYLGAILIIAITLLLRLPYVLLVPILNVDEATRAIAATKMNDGAILYVDVVTDTFPLIYYLYVVVFRIFGANNIMAVQLLGVIWTLLTTFVLYCIVRILGSGRAGFLTAIFYSVCSTTFCPPDMIAANTELFMVLPLAVGALFFLRGLRDGANRDYLIAGFFCGLGFLYKQPGIVDLGAMFLMLFVLFLAGKIKPLQASKYYSLVLAGFMVPLGIILIYYLVYGALQDFYFWAWLFRFRHFVAAVPIVDGMRIALFMLRLLIIPNLFFWIFVLISILSLRNMKFKSGYIFCWLWASFSLVGAAVGRRPFYHYYIQLIPPFAVLSGLGAAFAIDWFSTKNKKYLWTVMLKSAIAVSITVAILTTNYESLEPTYRPGHRKFYRLKNVEHPLKNLANYIRKNTLKTDSIYVWGFAHQIYVLAERCSASRFLAAEPVVGPVPFEVSSKLIPNVKETFLQDLEFNIPVYFIDTSMIPGVDGVSDHPIARYPFLWKYLHSNYELESVIDKNLVYRKREKPLAAIEIPSADDEMLRRIVDATLAIEVDSEFAQAYFFRAVAFDRLRQYRLALKDFEEFKQLKPEDPFAYLNLANIFNKVGNSQQAIENYRRSIELQPDFPPAYVELGFAYAREGRLDEAIAVFEKAVELAPNWGIGHFGLALCYYFRGDYDSTVLYRDRAISLGFTDMPEEMMGLE